MHACRRRPDLAVESRGIDVADLVLAAAAIHQHRAIAGSGGIGLTTVAGHRIDLGRGADTQIRVQHRRAQGHCAAAVTAAMTIVAAAVLLRAGTTGCVAAIEPRHADTAVLLRPHRHETVFGLGIVVMDFAWRAPVHAVVERAHQHHVVGVGRVGGLLQPVRPQRAVGGGGDMRGVGPVGEHRIADRHRARAFPVAVRVELGKLERRPAPADTVDPAEQHAAVGRERQVRLR